MRPTCPSVDETCSIQECSTMYGAIILLKTNYIEPLSNQATRSKVLRNKKKIKLSTALRWLALVSKTNN